MQELKTTILKVESLLLKHPILRDDENRLCATYWNIQLKSYGLALESMTALDFLKMMSEKKLTPESTITRARRKVNQDNEETRGKSYKGRKEKEIEYRQEINNI